MGVAEKRGITLCVTTAILLEYEEVLLRKRNPEVAKLVVEVVLLMPNLIRVETYFNFGLPTKDPDDQKFTDCAIACGATYLVTEDSDFNELKNMAFPVVQVVSPKAFRSIFKKT